MSNRMRKFPSWTVFLCVVFALFLSACGSGGSDSAESSTLDPQAVFTAAAQTAEARRVERFSQTATLDPQAILSTSAGPSPTATQQPSVAPSLQLSPTAGTPLPSAPPAGSDRAEYMLDVTIPDGTVMTPNQTFQKTWRILNSGQSTWTTDYVLIFIDGALMGAPATVPLPNSVAPSENIDITVDMVAPPDSGAHRGYWKLRNAAGQVFGFGADGSEAIWVDISVGGASDSTQAPAAGETPTPAANAAVSSISLSVDGAQVNGACPHTFIFTAQITLNKSATLTYSLETGATNGAEVRQPPPATQNLETGVHPVIYEVSIPSDFTGWARLHVTQPASAFSNQVDFSLTCG